MRVLGSVLGTRWLVAWTLVLMANAIEGQSIRREVDFPAGVATDLRNREYHFSRLDGEVWSAPNRAQGLRSRVSRGGLEVFPRTVDASGEGAEWKLRLRTGSFGRVGEARVVECRGVVIHANRVELDHGLLREWLVNDARGIEQGWTIAERPAGSSEDPLWIGLAFGGELQPRIAEDGLSATLVDANGTVRLHYRDLAAWDANGHDLPARLAPGPSGPGIRVDDAGAVYPITVDPTLVLSWSAQGDQEGARFGWSVSTAGDVNGDGYSDVLVGAPRYDHGEQDEGRVFLFSGSPSGLSSSASWTADGDQVGAELGSSVSTAGDVNGDGFADLVIGAPYHDGAETDDGRAYVYLGSSTGPALDPDWVVDGENAVARFGAAASSAGDVNGDGFSDVIVGSPYHDHVAGAEGRATVYLGASGGLSSQATWTGYGAEYRSNYGSSVSSAGDVNGDGYSDIILGAPRDSGVLLGLAYVYLGSASGVSSSPDWVVQGGQALARLGGAVSGAGDVNGDGYSDVIVSSSVHGNGEDREGLAYVYLGSVSGLESTPIWVGEGDQIDARFGVSVASAGDVNGDGYDDMVVGASLFDHGQQDEGRAYVYLGSSEGPSDGAITLEPDQAGAYFGLSVAGAGDVDGDGLSDIIVGAYGFEDGEDEEGGAFVYHGSVPFFALTQSPRWTGEGVQEGCLFGYSVSSAGDVNGDGFSDVIVSAPDYDGGQPNEGRALLFLGSASGPSSVAAWTADGNQDYAYFGWSLATAGDVNGDGYSDVAVGAIGFDDGQANEGGVFVYAGSPAGLSFQPAWTLESDQVGALFGCCTSTAGDVNGDGYSDLLVGAYRFDDGEADEGGVFLYRGSAEGLSTSHAWFAGGDQAGAFFGQAVSTAGDVNRDGYSDVVVGAPRFDHGETDEGMAFVYLGSASGLEHGAVWTAEGDQGDARLATRVSTAGDVNGDGFSDLLVGVPLFDDGYVDEGRVLLYTGSETGLSAIPEWTVEGEQASAWLGASFSSAGDVNGDGYSEVLVGAYGHDGEVQDGGRALVFLGSADGLAEAPIWTTEGDQAGAFFGFDLACAGDVDGDGFSDVVVSAIHHGAVGSASVYLGNEGGAARVLRLQQFQPNGSAPISLLGRSQSPYAFRIRVDVPAGPLGTTAFLEWEVEPLGVRFDGLDVGRSPVGQSLSFATLPLSFDELAVVEGWNGRPYHWRARVVFESGAGNPLYTPWFSLPGNAPTEAKLRFRQPEKRIRRRTTVPLDGNR